MKADEETMNQQPDDTPNVRRVVLPSGKTIEVVHFEDGHGHNPAGARDRQDAPHRSVDLHVCQGCAGELVFPVAWEESGPYHWEVELRCPDCEHRCGGRYAQEDVERFDEQLDRGTEVLVRDLKGLMQANMEDEVIRFVSALGADAILPEDF